MKNKFVLVIAAVLTVFFSLTSKAQDSKIMAGAGLGYATDISTLGISAKGVYLASDTWEIAPAFTYYLKKNNVNWSTLDFDAHYVFSTDESMTFYGIGGLNVTFWKFKMDGVSSGSSEFDDFLGGMSDLDASGSDIGVNIGVGSRFALSDKMYFNADLKYTIGGSNFLSAGVGLLYHF
ncbi:outer membrane beta-barrel protein [Labilibaculum sp.]|uniref:outer membrane beta-barrel protein n=1 Tax=Labilibaculum sp. TaxID=2060723 RepID=UPI002AA95A48|nr:outer membrane beta-barrel protein [Labilibaculum sp.]MBN2596651.1 outer membrane beta-barrel protein [Marinifilaceae bacterium]